MTSHRGNSEEDLVRLCVYLSVDQVKLVSDLQKRVTELQCKCSEVERSAEDHLHSLATRTEAAMNTAQLRLNSADEQLKEHAKFIKVCAVIYLSLSNKYVQLSLGKTRYSLYTSCCSTDLEGHPRSMIFISSERAYAISY